MNERKPAQEPVPFLMSPHNFKKVPGFSYEIPVLLQPQLTGWLGETKVKIKKRLLVNQHKKIVHFIIDNSLCELTNDRIAKEKKFMARKGKFRHPVL